MIRKAIIILLTLATASTGIAWVIAHVEDGIVFSAESQRRAILVEFAAGQLDVAVFQQRPRTGFFSFLPDYLAAETETYKDSRRLDRASARRHPSLAKQEQFYCAWYPKGHGAFDSLALNIGCPLWFLVTVLAAYPAITLIGAHVRRYRRRRKNLCLHCAYDLTGNVSGVCPECGRKIVGQVEELPSDAPGD